MDFSGDGFWYISVLCAFTASTVDFYTCVSPRKRLVQFQPCSLWSSGTVGLLMVFFALRVRLTVCELTQTTWCPGARSATACCRDTTDSAFNGGLMANAFVFACAEGSYLYTASGGTCSSSCYTVCPSWRLDFADFP